MDLYQGNTNNAFNSSTRGRPYINTNSYNRSYSGGGNNSFQQEYSGTNSEFWCDVCDRGFPNPYTLQKHISEHQTCNIDGCKYVAHPNAITKHIQMQHSTGLFNKIRSLNTPEDIEKWRNDRKRKYPSKENVEKRQKINKEKQERGEKLTNKSIRGGFRDRGASNVQRSNNNQRGGFKKRHRNRKPRTNTKPRPVNIEVITEINKDDWNGDLPPFPGTKLLFGAEESEPESATDSDDDKVNCNDDDFEDEEWEQQNNVIEDIPIKNALGLLMNNYGSSDEDDDANVCQGDTKANSVTETKIEPNQLIKKDTPNLETKGDIISEDEPPDEIVAIKDKPQDDSENIVDNTKKPKESQNQINEKKVNKDHVKTNNKPQFKKFRRQETLLEKLLRNEIRHERNILLQSIRYIVNNNFFGLEKQSDTKLISELNQSNNDEPGDSNK